MDWAGLVQSWGPAGAVVCGMGYIVHRFLTFQGNHLSRLTAALTDVCRTLEGLSTRIDRCPHN